ncbi:MAG TPA: tetratricopeptide repeat protein, partial [Pyrinomonadaceae bacterium]|nr:tetratricopeptide repeat protein [Pyrinomonadaceae bacterium]
LTENAAPSAAVTADGEASADAAAAKNSIAILPFKLIRPAERGAAGGDETTGDEYLSIGLADALGSRLSGVKRLVVRPTSSILRYANEADPFAAGRELNVEFIVGGSIRRTGDRVRVSVRLLSIGENAARWAEDFDEKMTDVLEIEDLISERVVRILVSHLTGEEKNQLAKRSTSNAEAYEAYLRGRYHWNQFTFEGFAKALAFYRRAIELAPDYALAYAGIADYYNFLGVYAVRPFAETTAATKKAAQQAIALDPTLAEAYAALGFASQMGDFDWEAAENHLLRSIELNPNYSTGRVWYSYHLGMTGRFEEAFAQVNKALEIDPFTPLVPQTYNWMLYHARRYDEAIAETYRLIEKEPQYGLSYVFLSGMLWHTGKYAEAVKVAHKMVEIMGRTGYTLCWLGSAYAAAGQLEEARAVIGELENLSATQYVSPYLLAMIYVNLRDREKTFELLEKAVEIRDGRLSYLAADPQFDLFRSDPRYNKILKAINHPSVTRPPESGSGGGSKTIGRENSIAVLPLKILGTRNPDDEYLGIGLTDSLITRLSNVRRFVMRPTSSVLQYANSPTDPFEAGRKLSVEYVLDGNLRRAGERIRVTVQLLSVRENAAVWAESFDEKSSDVLELEDSISEKVAQSLIPQLTGEERRQLEKRGTNNPEAYEEYLRGRYFWNQFTNESLPKALASFQKAVALDPEYAAAYVGLADFYNWAGIFGILPSMDCYREAKRAALRALEIDDQLSEANAAFAFITAFGDWKWADGENFIKRAIQLNPSNALAHEWYSTMLMATGRIEQGLAEIRRAEKLDPFSLRAKTLTTWTFYQGRLYEEAAAKAQELIEMDPNYWQGYVQLGNTYIQTGRAREATKLLQHALKLAPGSGITLYKLCFALVAENRVSEAREILRQLADGGAVAGYSKPYFVAMGHVALGESDAAFEWFEKAVQVRDGWLVWLLTETKLDPLRPDARFINLLRRLNFPTGGIDYGGSRGQRS